jgi:hypothetical protein
MCFIFADIVSVAQYILVVEKETGKYHMTFLSLRCALCFDSIERFVDLSFLTVFQRLANDKFCDRNRCIVVTVSKRPCFLVLIFLHITVKPIRLFTWYYFREEAIPTSQLEGRYRCCHLSYWFKRYKL